MSSADLKILLIGRSGQVATDLQTVLPSIGSVSCVGRPEIDLARPDSIREMIRDRRPNVVINAAAYTAVDKAESEPELAMTINAKAPGLMAEEAKRLGALFITYSSDYVFDGKKSGPYTEDDEPNPLNIYGISKLAGDRAVQSVGGSYIIFRTSWVYSVNGKNFLNTIAKLATERAELNIVDDQIGAPTWSKDIASATAQIIRHCSSSSLAGKAGPLDEAFQEHSGVYNLTAGGSVTWFEFAEAILEEIKKHLPNLPRLARLVPVATSEYPTPAKRPLNSQLDNAKVRGRFSVSLPLWRESLAIVARSLKVICTPPQ